MLFVEQPLGLSNTRRLQVVVCGIQESRWPSSGGAKQSGGGNVQSAI